MVHAFTTKFNRVSELSGPLLQVFLDKPWAPSSTCANKWLGMLLKRTALYPACMNANHDLLL